jgi:hypothetical protein
MISTIYEDLLTEKCEYEKITYLHIYNKTIDDFDIFYKCINIEKLAIKDCIYDYKKYFNFDFSKLTKLKYLEISENFVDEYKYDYYKICDIISKKFNYPEKILNIFRSYLQLKYKENCLEKIKNRTHDLEYNNEQLELDYIKHANYFSEIYYKYNQYKFEKLLEIPLNESIFNCKLTSLIIDTCKIKELFNKLPDDCELLNNLNYLGHQGYYNEDINILFDISKIESESDICKILLFKKLNYNIFDFINSDYSEITAIDINKQKKPEDCIPIDNIILYYKKKCLLHIIYNKHIELKDDIEDLQINIERKDYAFEDQKLEDNIEILDNLPNIINLQITCSNEYNDNYSSNSYGTKLKINNLPFSVKNIKLIDICSKTEIKLPFDCNLECKYYDFLCECAFNNHSL